MRSRAVLFFGLCGLGACISTEPAPSRETGAGDTGSAPATDTSIEGTWLLQLPYVPAEDESCGITIQHSFLGASLAGDHADPEAPWTESTTTDRSDALVFVQIEQLGADRAVLLMAGEALPGTGSGNDWTFTWGNLESQRNTTRHESGYESSQTETTTRTVTLAVSVTGDTATGSWTSTTDTERGWAESDAWDELSVGTTVGEIPSSYYVFDNASGEGVENLSNTADCEAGLCELTITQSCSQTAPIQLDRTGHGDAEAYDELADIGQPFGSGG
jgi:hypothetical protein